MSDIEAELVKASTFRKKRATFTEYQEYLQALVMACDKITDDDFDNLTEGAADWYQEAVTAMNKKRDIPDFADAIPEEIETDVGEEEEEETVEEVEEVEEVDEPAEVDEETPEAEVEEAAGEENETPEEADNESPEPDVGPAAEEVPAEPKLFPGPSRKQPRKPIKGRGKYIKRPNRKPTTQPKHKPGLEPDYKAIDGRLDRYGITAGTKASMVLKMFEKGHSMRDATLELGGTYYVVLRKLAKGGHKVERLKNGIFKLTHKDDLVKKVKGK